MNYDSTNKCDGNAILLSPQPQENFFSVINDGGESEGIHWMHAKKMVIKELCNHKEKWGQLESALVSFGFSHDVQQFVMAIGDDDIAAVANGDHNNGHIDSLNAASRINSTNDN